MTDEPRNDTDALDRATDTAAPGAAPAAPADGSDLGNLMADGVAGAAPRGRNQPDLDAEALRAAEAAIAESERVLAQARAQLQAAPAARPQAARSAAARRRQLALRLVLAFNVAAMIVVALLPAPPTGGNAAPTPPAHEQVDHGPSTKLNDPWNRALAAAEQREFSNAVAILETYLADTPRMAQSQQLNVLMTLSHYAARMGDFARAQEFQRRADAIEQSHSLPEDLVAEAEAAARDGDHERLRRIWARFLLQQRQIPSFLQEHVAKAYLQLGDSYRQQADAAAERVRLAEIQAAVQQLRDGVLQAGENK